MSINVSSELMKNQQHAVVMSPTSQFEVLQTTDGDSIFFSIGTDNVFYATREVQANTQGWTQTDLSSALSANYNNATVAAKLFDVSQVPGAGAIDVALVITVNSDDYLYLSLGNAASDAAWSTPITWLAIPYDDTSHPFTGLSIADVYVAASGGTEYVIVDIITNATTKTIFRYYIDPTKKLTGQFWNAHDISGNLQAGSITNCLGRKTGQLVDGIYTMGTIVNEQELLYTPLYNAFNVKLPATATDFTIPAGATAMALSVNAQGFTDLFIAANGTLCFLAASAQINLAAPAVVYTHPLFTAVQSLYVNNSSTLTAVWGVNQAGQLFYLTAPAGSESSASSWSCPIPIETGVVNVATYLNTNANNNVIFVHLQDNTLLQLTQDPVTTAWQERSIVLPPTSVDDMVEVYTYTTRIQFTNNNLALPSTPATITATSPCSVYINNSYYVLSTTTPLAVTSDTLGVINIVQQVDGISAVCYNVTAGGQTQNINPMTNVISQLQGVSTGTNLDVNVTDELGNSTPLVGTGISTDQKNQTAGYIQQFVQANSSMPANGSLLNSNTSSLVALAMNKAGALSINASTPDLSNAIDAAAGDIWRWMKYAASDVENIYFQVESGVTHFFIQLGNDIYHIVLNCMSDVAHGIDFVMNKIAVGVEEMVEWLGYIFSWTDIVTAHKVMRNVLLCYINQCIGGVATLSTDIQNAFTNLETNINNWAGLPTLTTTYSGLSTTSQSTSDAMNNPQSHWGVYHAQNNMGGITSSDNSTGPSLTQDIETILGDLLTMMQNEEDAFTNAFAEVKQLITDLPSLTITQIIQRVIAIITDTILTTVENFITTLLSILGVLLTGAAEVVTSPIDIPVISAMYKKYAGEDLSILDLSCLVTSIPVVVAYKIFYGVAPFESTDPTTASLMNAPDFATIQSICNGSSSVSANAPSAALSLTATAPLTTTIDKLTFAGNMMGAAGGLLQAGLGIWKYASQENPVAAAASAIAYFPYIGPDIIGSIPDLKGAKWYAWMNAGVAAFGASKACVDAVIYKKAMLGGATWAKVSPWADFAINTVWEVPVIGSMFDSEHWNTDGMLNYCGNTLFDISGIVSPVVAMNVNPASPIAVATASLSNVGYALCCFLQSVPGFSSGNNNNNNDNNGNNFNAMAAPAPALVATPA